MSAEIELYVDVIGHRVVKSLNSQDAFQINPVFQGSILQLRVYPVRPTPRNSAPFFTKEDISNLSLRIMLGARGGGENILAAQYTWAKNNAEGYFYADLNLNTAPMNAAIGASEVFTTYFEIALGNGGIYRTVAQFQVQILATVKDPDGAPVEVPGLGPYLTAADAAAIFVKRRSDPGETITLVSPDGSRERILGCNDDGSAQDDVI
jgi:hypothetical protein